MTRFLRVNVFLRGCTVLGIVPAAVLAAKARQPASAVMTLLAASFVICMLVAPHCSCPMADPTFERVVGTDRRFAERRDPKLRPPDAVPVEFVLLGYPILDAPPLPDTDEADEDPAG